MSYPLRRFTIYDLRFTAKPMDPNKTLLTNFQNLQDPLKTQALNAADFGKTTAMEAFAPGGKALSIEVLAGRAATMANGPAREQFLVELHATGSMGGGVRTPLNLCLVIDRSGSMEGPPLEYVKMACTHVVDMLNQDDVLSFLGTQVFGSPLDKTAFFFSLMGKNTRHIREQLAANIQRQQGQDETFSLTQAIQHLAHGQIGSAVGELMQGLPATQGLVGRLQTAGEARMVAESPCINSPTALPI